jgi:hypothetical protein
VGSALDAAHQEGLIHRDVKPANILLVTATSPDGSDHVYLTDFGLTKFTGSDSGVTKAGQFVGTPDYVAPEQIQGERVDARADIYSLGCVAYQCLTGVVPFPKDVEVAVLWAHINDPPPHVRNRVPGLPPITDSVVETAMAKRPADRYRTCREFVVELRRALGVGSGDRAAVPTISPTATTADATVIDGSTGTGGGPGGQVPQVPQAPLAPSAPAPGQETVAATGTIREPEPMGAWYQQSPPPAPIRPGATVPTVPAPAMPPAMPPMAVPSAPAPPPRPARSQRSLAMIVGAAALAVVVIAVAAIVLTRHKSQAPKPPPAPTLQVAVEGTKEIKLTWTPVTDKAGITGYAIYRNGNILDTVTGRSNTYQDAQLDADTSYAYSVQALDAAGLRSGRSVAVTVKTPAVPFPNATESAILARVPSSIRPDCKRADSVPNGAEGSVTCTSGSVTIDYSKFNANPPMYAYYDEQLAAHQVPHVQGHCPTRLPSEEYWYYRSDPKTHLGRLACYHESGRSWVIWTYNRYSLYVVAFVDGSNEEPVYRFWVNNA